MPIHDLGYRKWQGRLTPEWSRWMVVADTGLRRVWQNAWVRRITFFSWLPLLVPVVFFFLFELAARGTFPGLQTMVLAFASTRDFGAELSGLRPGVEATEALVEARHAAWTWILSTYLLYPQKVALILLVGMIAPRLISEDVSSRAFLFYFSRPLTRFEYVLGKSATVWTFLAGITLIPALILYVLGVAFSASPAVILDTWDIPIRVFAASLAVIIPTTAVALCFSSMTRESRYAGFAWFAMWILGIVSWLFIRIWRSFRMPDSVATGNEHNLEEFFSVHHMLSATQSWIFGLDKSTLVLGFMVVLGLVTVTSLAILFRRVSAPMRA